MKRITGKLDKTIKRVKVRTGEIRRKTVGEENKKHKNKNTEREGETRWREGKYRRSKVG
jgi:hypothetical protein